MIAGTSIVTQVIARSGDPLFSLLLLSVVVIGKLLLDLLILCSHCRSSLFVVIVVRM